jgi:hypothetical protein
MSLYVIYLREDRLPWKTVLKFKLEYDRHPGRKVWLGSFEDTISGLEIRARVKMKPILLKLDGERWLRVDPEELLALEKRADGKAVWHTLRGDFQDLETTGYQDAVEKANRAGVFVSISATHSISPQRIIGIRLQKRGFHVLELEGPDGEPLVLGLDPIRLPLLEECLEAINLGDGFLITGPDEE